MLVQRRKPLSAKVGIVGVGHDSYSAQFDGLLKELMGYLDVFDKQVRACGVDVVNFGMIDSARAAYAAVAKIQAAGLDLLFVDMLTYATSCTWGILARELRMPIVLVALQPLRAMNYAKATTYIQLCNDN